jgi:hypothetical protein
MGFLDKIKELLDQHDDKVDQALDKIGEAAKAKFTGQDGLIDGLVGKAKAATGDGDTTAAPPNTPTVEPVATAEPIANNAQPAGEDQQRE